MDDDLVLTREIDARRALRDRRLRLSLLAPYGSWFGCGMLRVLRVKPREDDYVELVVGYESYERVAAGAGA